MGNGVGIEKDAPLVFNCPALGEELGHDVVYHTFGLFGQEYNFNNKTIEGVKVNGRGWALCPLKIQDNSIVEHFKFDGSSIQNCAIRLARDNPLALEINFRKIKAGSTLSLWHNTGHSNWASRFCMNDDMSLSPIENRNLVVGMGTDNKSIGLVWKADVKNKFTFFNNDQMVMNHLMELTNKDLRTERFMSKAIEIMTKDDVCSSLRENGFVKLTNVIDPNLLDDALGEVHFMLGQSKDVEVFQNKNVPQGPALSAVFNDSVLPFIFSFLFGCAVEEVQRTHGAQVALRFPGDGCMKDTRLSTNDHWKGVSKGWHIDGLPSDFLPGMTDHFGEIQNFDALVGVLLRDVPEVQSGEVCFYSGSHQELAEWIGESPDRLELLKIHGMAALPKSDQVFKEVSPFHGTGKKGDVFIANYMTAHLIAPNTSVNIRYALYFRIKSPRFGRGKQYCEESILNPWIHWPGICGPA